MHDVSLTRDLYLCDATGSTHQRGHVSEAQMDSRHDVSHSTTLRSSLGIGATPLQLSISCPVPLLMACGSQQASQQQREAQHDGQSEFQNRRLLDSLGDAPMQQTRTFLPF